MKKLDFKTIKKRNEISKKHLKNNTVDLKQSSKEQSNANTDSKSEAEAGVVDEALLVAFDMDPRLGPFVGLSRQRRYERAPFYHQKFNTEILKTKESTTPKDLLPFSDTKARSLEKDLKRYEDNIIRKMPSINISSEQELFNSEDSSVKLWRKLQLDSQATPF